MSTEVIRSTKTMYYPFDEIPDDIIRLIFSFADIPTISRVSQCNKGLLSLCDEQLWSSFVEQRFRIRTKKTRPKSQGGKNWKEAFRSLSSCARIPKTRFTNSRKIVFAKGGTALNDAVRLWVLLGHTDNCQTRSSRDPCDSNKYVELYLTVQNVKSGFCTVEADMSNATFEFVGSLGEVYSHKVVTEGNKKPKILSHNCRHCHNFLADAEEPDLDILTSSLVLQPFEFVVLSVHFPVAPDMTFETDLLARALTVSVPVKPSTRWRPAEHNALRESSNINNACELARSYFLPEKTIWNYYMELPGNCVILVEDRNRMLDIY